MTKDDLSLLITMKDGADKLVKSLDTPASCFKIGFHSVPSMIQLHLHVISKDFASISLKNKKHWNSFTTSFFRLYDDVVEELEREGSIIIDEERAEASLKMALVCPICGTALRNMPTTKEHHKACYLNSLK